MSMLSADTTLYFQNVDLDNIQSCINASYANCSNAPSSYGTISCFKTKLYDLQVAYTRNSGEIRTRMRSHDDAWTNWTKEKCYGSSLNNRYYYINHPDDTFAITFDASDGSLIMQGTKSDGQYIQKRIVTQ